MGESLYTGCSSKGGSEAVGSPAKRRPGVGLGASRLLRIVGKHDPEIGVGTVGSTVSYRLQTLA